MRGIIAEQEFVAATLGGRDILHGARGGIDARDYRQEAAINWKNILYSLLVQRFEKRQTEAPERGTKPNVTDGPVSPALLGSTFTWLRVGTDLLSQSLR